MTSPYLPKTVAGSALLPVTDAKVAVCALDPEPDLWTSEFADDRRLAKWKCRSCPLIEPCLATARANGEKRGVWGGVDFLQGPDPKACIKCGADINDSPTYAKLCDNCTTDRHLKRRVNRRVSV